MCKANEDTAQIHEWCRHVDSVMWTVAGIMIGVLTGIVIYQLKHPSQIAFIPGTIITYTTVYFTASFRATRRQLHSKLEKHIVDLIRPPKGMKQMPVFMLLILFLMIFWVYSATTKYPSSKCLCIIIGITTFILMIRKIHQADKKDLKPSE